MLAHPKLSFYDCCTETNGAFDTFVKNTFDVDPTHKNKHSPGCNIYGPNKCSDCGRMGNRSGDKEDFRFCPHYYSKLVLVGRKFKIVRVRGTDEVAEVILDADRDQKLLAIAHVKDLEVFYFSSSYKYTMTLQKLILIDRQVMGLILSYIAENETADFEEFCERKLDACADCESTNVSGSDDSTVAEPEAVPEHSDSKRLKLETS
ncbi:hypothetical protein HDE_12478 [Halotydeus destructor]|nr:hypothetical protein HDE_12478 [Halotydeus destructor]